MVNKFVFVTGFIKDFSRVFGSRCFRYLKDSRFLIPAFKSTFYSPKTAQLANNSQGRQHESTYKTLKKTCDHSEVETIDISTPPESRVDATYCKTCDSWNVHRGKQA